MKTLVLGMGNDLLGDDAVGVLAVRALYQQPPPDTDLCETALHGLALMDFFIGYDRAIIVDAIITGRHPVGTIHTLRPEDFAPVAGPSPHYTGLPEMIALARALNIPFPQEIVILAVETLNQTVIGADPSPSVLSALPDITDRITATLARWAFTPTACARPEVSVLAMPAFSRRASTSSAGAP